MSHFTQRKKSKACKTINYILLWVLLAAVFSCGYHFRAADGSIGKELKSIAIPILSSPSSFIGVEGDLARIVRDEFIAHSKVKIVGQDKAQCILYCQIYSIKTAPLSYSVLRQSIYGYNSTEKVTNVRELNVTIDVKFEDARTGKIIWEDLKLTEKARFQVGTDPLSALHNQRQAFTSIARSLAKRIYSNTMERF